MYGGSLKKNKKNFLIIGGGGNLGSYIIKYKKKFNLSYPPKNKLNILKIKTILGNINKDINVIINCSGFARVRACEENPKKAFEINATGVNNLVKAISISEKKFNTKILLIHISTDAVYESIHGNYREIDKCRPQNIYGKSKLMGEKYVKKLKNYLIIRTRFFSKEKIKYKDAAIDIYTSMIEVKKLVNKIFILSLSNFTGIINIGGQRKSDYQILRKYKKLKKTTWREISKKSNVFIAQDSSLNTERYKKLFAKK